MGRLVRTQHVCIIHTYMYKRTPTHTRTQTQTQTTLACGSSAAAFADAGVLTHVHEDHVGVCRLRSSHKAWQRMEESLVQPCPQVLGFRVQGLGFRVQGLGFRIYSLGFMFQRKTKVNTKLCATNSPRVIATTLSESITASITEHTASRQPGLARQASQQPSEAAKRGMYPHTTLN